MPGRQGMPGIVSLSDKDTSVRCQSLFIDTVCVQKSGHRLASQITMNCCAVVMGVQPKIRPCERACAGDSKGCIRDNDPLDARARCDQGPFQIDSKKAAAS